MKKTSISDGVRHFKPGMCAAANGSAADNSRNSKLYAARLADLGLLKAPVVAQVKTVRQFHLAHLAATLAKDAAANASAGELVGRALQIWNASGSAVFVEELATFILKGICVFDRKDWDSHARTLIGLLDDAEGAVPGQSPSEQVQESYAQAQGKAGAALVHLWRRKRRGEEVVRALFPAKSETEQSRAKKLVELLEFAKARVAGCDELTWIAKDGNRLKGCILHAWQPFGISKDDELLFSAGMDLVGAWLEKPSSVAVSHLGFSPMVARWLSVIRMEQLAAAKNRC